MHSFGEHLLLELGDTLAGRVALLRYAKIRNDQAKEFAHGQHRQDLDRYEQSIARVRSAMRTVQSEFTPQNMDAFMRATKGMQGWKKIVLRNQRQIDKRRTGINRALAILNKGKPYQGPPSISEDIELIQVSQSKPYPYHTAEETHRHYKKVLKAKGKNLGDIHPDYELHQHTATRVNQNERVHYFTIVHKPSGIVAGSMVARGGRIHPIKGFEHSLKGKGLRVIGLDMQPEHRSKRIGVSLPVELYRRLHRLGYGIQSDTTQSHGAAHVWNLMRHDRELKKHMMIHDRRQPLRGELHTFIKRAYRFPEKEIWNQFSRSWGHRPKVEPTYNMERNHERTLILSGKKRKKR